MLGRAIDILQDLLTIFIIVVRAFMIVSELDLLEDEDHSCFFPKELNPVLLLLYGHLGPRYVKTVFHLEATAEEPSTHATRHKLAKLVAKLLLSLSFMHVFEAHLFKFLVVHYYFFTFIGVFTV